MEAAIFMGSIGAVLGACLASWMSAVIYRLPRRMDLVRGRSECPMCLHPLRGADNVPVFGWLRLHGKCHHCRAPISARYVFLELFGAAAGATIGVLLGPVALAITAAALIVAPVGVHYYLSGRAS